MDEERQFLEEAMQCAENGDANHWPSVANILAYEITRLRAELAETQKREQEILSERKGEGVRTRRAIAEAKKKWLAEAEGVSYRYRCHNCGSHTPPPEPFKFYVTCKDCGVSTATTAAEEAHPAPAKVPEVNFDDVPVSVKELTPEAAWICGYYAYREAMLEAQGGE